MDKQGEVDPDREPAGAGEPATGAAIPGRNRRELLEWASRRGVSLGLVGLAAPALRGAWAGLPAASAGPTFPTTSAAAPAPGGPAGWAHAQGAPRGIEAPAIFGRETEGRFGILFKNLAPFAPPDNLLMQLASTMLDPG